MMKGSVCVGAWGIVTEMVSVQEGSEPVEKKEGQGLVSISLGEPSTNKGMMCESWRHEWVGSVNRKLISGLKLR